MAKIPEFRRAPVRDLSDGGRISRSQQIGRAASNLGGNIQDMGFRIMNVEAQNYANEKGIEMKKEFAQIQQEWAQENQENPTGATKQLEQKLEESRDRYLKDSPNMFGKKRVNDMFNQMKGSYSQAGIKWERETLVRNTGAKAKQNIDSIRLEAYERGISNLDVNLKELEPIAEPLKSITDKVIYDETLIRGRQSVALAAFESEIDNGNVELAEQMLKSKKYNESLGADGVERITKRIGQRRKTSKESMAKLDKLRLTKPYVFLEKSGVQVDDVNVLDSANLANSLEKRFIEKEQLAQQYATEIPILKENEMLQIQTFTDNGNVEERVQFLQQLRDSTPSQYLGEMTRQLFDKQPAKAMALNLSIEKPEVSREIIQGDDLLRSGQYRVNQNEFSLTVQEYLGNAIENPDAIRQISEGAKSLYAKRASEAGKTDYDGNIAEDAIENIIGPTPEINDRKTISFMDKNNNYLDGDDLEELIENINPDFLKKNDMEQAVMGNGNPVDWDDVADDGQLVAVGDGKYNIVMPTNNGDSTLVNQSGGAFVLDLKRANELIDRRGFFTKAFD